jgi:hypothetical protein
MNPFALAAGAVLLLASNTSLALEKAEIEVGDHDRMDSNNHPALIVRIDGGRNLRRDPNATIRIPPGPHYVDVMSTRPRRGGPEIMPLYFRAEECARYIVTAQHENQFPNSPWQVRVLRAEPIVGCEPESDEDQG